MDSKRSETLIPIFKQLKHVILLTGTPAFARPKELFNLMNILRPDIINSFTNFGNRYCDPRYNHFSKKIEYDGHKNDLELNFILKSNFMIRRLKKDVLSELPSKIRSRVHIEADRNKVK